MNETTESTQSPYKAGGAVYGRLGPIEGVRDSASSVLNDAFDLAEMQGRLFVQDSRECTNAAKVAVVGLIVSLALLIASLPVVAMGLSQGLSWGLQWPLWISQLAVGLSFTVCGILIGYLCVKRLRNSLSAFEASRVEIGENIRWFRNALSRTFSS